MSLYKGHETIGYLKRAHTLRMCSMKYERRGIQNGGEHYRMNKKENGEGGLQFAPNAFKRLKVAVYMLCGSFGIEISCVGYSSLNNDPT